jgi:hypothetical protein
LFDGLEPFVVLRAWIRSTTEPVPFEEGAALVLMSSLMTACSPPWPLSLESSVGGSRLSPSRLCGFIASGHIVSHRYKWNDWSSCRNVMRVKRHGRTMWVVDAMENMWRCPRNLRLEVCPRRCFCISRMGICQTLDALAHDGGSGIMPLSSF